MTGQDFPRTIRLPEHRIETWYDRITQLWVTQLKDAQGNQIGDAMFDGARDGVPRSQEILRLRATSAATGK